jgi:hypothetical protein
LTRPEFRSFQLLTWQVSCNKSVKITCSCTVDAAGSNMLRCSVTANHSQRTCPVNNRQRTSLSLQKRPKHALQPMSEGPALSKQQQSTNTPFTARGEQEGTAFAQLRQVNPPWQKALQHHLRFACSIVVIR